MFFVNGATGSDGNNCLSAASACHTIKGAVSLARATGETNTIKLAAGTYAESVILFEPGDTGLTIEGTPGASVIQAVGSSPAVAAAEGDERLTLRHLRLVAPPSDTGAGLVFVAGTYEIEDVAVEMQDPASTGPAVIAEKASGTANGLTVGGAWTGRALISVGSLRMSNSNLHSSEGVILVADAPGGHDDVITTSTLQGSSVLGHNNILAVGVDLTIDSSLLLGGNPYGIEWIQQKEPTLASMLTVASSTIDAGVLGTADPPGVYDVFAASEGPAGVPARVRIEGSIGLEEQFSGATEVKDPMLVECSNSDVPSQTQAQAGTEGAIACANGSSGNTTSTPASLFVAPGSNYQLNASSSAIGSVPAGAISLPSGLVPSATDLLGNARTGDGTDSCFVNQDKGAFELQGHLVTCPSAPPPPPQPVVAKPVAGVISALTVAPRSFKAAPSGATVSSASRYGATISWRDSQQATTTLTVLAPAAGRMQGHACKKPSKANRHGHRCTRYNALGSFTHTDVSGTDSLHFSGRLRGHKLAAGSYRLQAMARDAAGNGPAAITSFSIK
jgi:hypothetical protein